MKHHILHSCNVYAHIRKYTVHIEKVRLTNNTGNLSLSTEPSAQMVWTSSTVGTVLYTVMYQYKYPLVIEVYDAFVLLCSEV